MGVRLVVLTSGNGSKLQAILNACEADRLPARVAAVISDRRWAFGLVRARFHGVPGIYFPWKPYADGGQNRQAYDTALAQIVTEYQPDYVILAGWLRMLSMDFLVHFPEQVINIHPALPGSFTGADAIERAYEAYQAGQITHTGVMVHYVANERSGAGPVLATAQVAIKPDDRLNDLKSRIAKVEHRLLVDTVQRVLESKTQHE